jgi:hypothetical protein
LPALNAVLTDLHGGLQINDALGRHCGGLEPLQASFEQFLRQQADKLAPAADFSKEPLQTLQEADIPALAELSRQNPQHAFQPCCSSRKTTAGKRQCGRADTAEAAGNLSAGSSVPAAHARCSLSCIANKDAADAERQVLTEHLQRTADDVQAALRLQELSLTAQAWPDVIRYGQQIFAADPFRTEVHERMLQAGQATGDVAVMSAALQCLLQLQPDDAARLNFRLAQVLQPTSPAEAQRRVLLALEQSPRYREAHQFLLSLQPAPAPRQCQSRPRPRKLTTVRQLVLIPGASSFNARPRRFLMAPPKTAAQWPAPVIPAPQLAATSLARQFHPVTSVDWHKPVFIRGTFFLCSKPAFCFTGLNDYNRTRTLPSGGPAAGLSASPFCSWESARPASIFVDF